MTHLHGATRVAPDSTGRLITYRQIALGDLSRLEQFHKELSPQTVRQRFSSVVPLRTRIERKRLERQCAIDEDHTFALVALYDEHLLGIARFTRTQMHKGELAFVVRDADQTKHIGKELFRTLLGWIRENHSNDRERFLVTAQMASTNERMKALFRAFGFAVELDPKDYTQAIATLAIN